MIKLVIHGDRCKGCGLCTKYCPRNNLKPGESLNPAGYHPVEQGDPAQCTGCGICALMCPDVCFEIYRVEEEAAK